MGIISYKITLSVFAIVFVTILYCKLHRLIGLKSPQQWIFYFGNQNNVCLVLMFNACSVVQDIQVVIYYVRTNHVPELLEEESREPVKTQGLCKKHLFQCFFNILPRLRSCQISIHSTIYSWFYHLQHFIYSLFYPETKR